MIILKEITSITQKIDKFLKKELSEYRYLHSVSVAESSQKLAIHFGFYNFDLAYFVGLSHDIGRELSFVYLTDLTKKLGRWRDIDAAFPFVLHGRIAFHLVQKLTGFYLKEADQSFIFHTTGHRDMSELDRIVYIADFIEPRRHYMENIHFDFNHFTLETLALEVLKRTIRRLRDRNAPLHFDTQAWIDNLKSQA